MQPLHGVADHCFGKKCMDGGVLVRLVQNWSMCGFTSTVKNRMNADQSLYPHGVPFALRKRMLNSILALEAAIIIQGQRVILATRSVSFYRIRSASTK